MDLNVPLSTVLLTALNVLFVFWPVILIAPIFWRRVDRLRIVALLWLFLGIGKLIYEVSLEAPFEFLIPEPQNTMLFGGFGVLLLGIWIVEKRPSSSLRRTRDTCEFDDE